MCGVVKSTMLHGQCASHKRGSTDCWKRNHLGLTVVVGNGQQTLRPMAGNVFQTQTSANRNAPLTSQRGGQTAKLGGGSSWAFGMPMGAGAPGLSAASRTPLAGFAQAIGASASQAPLDLSYVHHLLLHSLHPSHPLPKTITQNHCYLASSWGNHKTKRAESPNTPLSTSTRMPSTMLPCWASHPSAALPRVITSLIKTR